MEIYIDKVQLAGTGFETHGGLQINGGPALDPQEFLRGSEIDVQNRGNLRFTVEFSVLRKFDSKAKAEAFLLDHAADACTVGVVRFRDAGIERFMKGGVQISTSPAGLTVMYSYSIIGGAISKERPT